MPQVKCHYQTRTHGKADSPAVIQRPTLADARDLIGKMLDYEAAALNQGIDLAASQFTQLTTAERQLIRAELIADYIRLSSGDTCGTSFGAALHNFCSKICSMNVPSHELIGTYLAALDIVTADEYAGWTPSLVEAIRQTMTTVLQGCVDYLQENAKPVNLS